MHTIKINASQMWQTTKLDEAIAEEFFGWRWLAYSGRPMRGHPDYHKEIRVRRFYPPLESIKSKSVRKQWEDYFARVPHEQASGEEPLCYSYCSSNGPHRVPHFSGHWDAIRELEVEIDRRKLWNDYESRLATICDAWAKDGIINQRKLRKATCEQRCVAALAAIGSKYIKFEPAVEAAE